MKASILTGLALLAAQSAEFSKFVVPNTPDLTIKTRRTYDHENSSTLTEIVYLKGARQRRDSIVEQPRVGPPVGARRTFVSTSITQCDERRAVSLYPEAKTYLSFPIENPSEYRERVRRAASQRPPPEPTGGGDVTITLDSVDTGERRQVGSYIARHVITTTTTEPGPGASTRTSADREDGWYIDLPSANCWERGNQPEPFALGTVLSADAPRDREHVEIRGTARRGYPIEATSRSETEAGTFTSKLELIEFSDASLDSALFTVPSGYRPALPRLFGGYDLTKADTLANRLQSYWQELVSRASRLFR